MNRCCDAGVCVLVLVMPNGGQWLLNQMGAQWHQKYAPLMIINSEYEWQQRIQNIEESCKFFFEITMRCDVCQNGTHKVVAAIEAQEQIHKYWMRSTFAKEHETHNINMLICSNGHSTLWLNKNIIKLWSWKQTQSTYTQSFTQLQELRRIGDNNVLGKETTAPQNEEPTDNYLNDEHTYIY